MIFAFHWRPESVFLFFATLVGFFVCFAVPPLAGGKEVFDFERAIAIAYGHLRVEKADVPAGIVRFTEEADGFFKEGLQPPFSYPRAEFSRMSALRLDAGHTATILPGPLTVNHPFCFMPQALLMRIGSAFGASPLVLMYLARLSGLTASILLTYQAIRTMPSHRWGLCALALLPPISFSRSCVDSDQLTTGLAFLFIASVLREINRRDPISGHTLILLGLEAFVLAQCKNVYLMLPLLMLAIPVGRFTSRARCFAAFTAVILPGMIASLAWMVMIKQGTLAGATYYTVAGEVSPDRQMAFVLHHPFAYLTVLLRTLFMTPFFPAALTGLLGIFGPPISLPPVIDILLLFLFMAALVSDLTGSMAYSMKLHVVSMAVLMLFLGVSLTSLYLQWTGVQALTVQGFQGRYLYPLLPLALILVRPPARPVKWTPALPVFLLAVTGEAAMLSKTLWTYYA